MWVENLILLENSIKIPNIVFLLLIYCRCVNSLLLTLLSLKELYYHNKSAKKSIYSDGDMFIIDIANIISTIKMHGMWFESQLQNMPTCAEKQQQNEMSIRIVWDRLKNTQVFSPWMKFITFLGGHSFGCIHLTQNLFSF